MKLSLRSFFRGLAVTSAATVVSAGVALWGFRNTYYLAPLLPACMVFNLLIAWLIYLKRTWLRSSSQPPRDPISSILDLPPDKVSGKELAYLRDKNGLIMRQEPARTALQDRTGGYRLHLWTFLWSALQLGVLATVLYYWLGIGASYYR